VKFSNDIDFLKQSLDKAGICVLHAPLFHPAMKNVAPIRRELGVKTFFNMLGPMVNPAFPKNQMVGVFSLELLRMYSYLYQNTDKNYSIIHALDGYDEVSLTGAAKIVNNQTEQVLAASDFGVSQLKQKDIYGGDSVLSSAKIFIQVLDGMGTVAQNNVVCANAALAISTVKNTSITDSFQMAKTSLLSGSAKQSFKTLVELSKLA
jgi:anthranilate phosphoribosyltransferase